MAERILIIDDDIDTLKLVGLMLQKHGYQIIAANHGKKGLEEAEKEDPDIILLDVMMPDMDGYEITRKLRASPVTANTPILMFTAKTQLDDKVTGFDSGADDYLTKPTHPSELHAHVKSLLARSKKEKTPTKSLESEKQTFIIGVVSPRGGLGITTVSVNLSDALFRMGKKPVFMAELRPGMGTLGPELGIPDPKGLVEILSHPSEINRQKVEENTIKHPTGIHILFGSVQPKDASFMSSLEPFSSLVKVLTEIASYLILDLGAGLTPLVQLMLPLCNMVLVLVEPVQNSVIHAKAFISDLLDMGFQKQNIKVIINNRIRNEIQLNLHQVEELLEHHPLVMITPAPELLYTANRMKTTAVSAKPDSVTAQQFTQLAQGVANLPDDNQ